MTSKQSGRQDRGRATIAAQSEQVSEASEKTAETAERAAEASEAISDSSKDLTTSAVQMTGSADRRTELAANRTVLAAERTYAAWIRTGLAALASGIGARALLDGIVPDWLALAAASLLILFSAFCFVVAVWRELFPSVSDPAPEIRRLPAPALLVANGFLALVALSALVGIWFADPRG